jgi:hypothetical protein
MIIFVCFCFAAPLFAQGPPDFSGRVERWETDGTWGWFYGYGDTKRGYAAFHGVDVEVFCVDRSAEEWGIWSVQDVWLPPTDMLIKTTEKGDDMPTSVWPIVIFDDTVYDHWCDGVLDPALESIATGTTDVIVTDNDLTGGWYENTPRMNAFKLSAHGVLYATEGGEPMMFSGGYNCQWPGYPDVWSETGKCKEKIVLR